jgi:tellurite resistance protein TerC
VSIPFWVWATVIAAIAVIFVFSLVVGRKAHVISVGEAGRWVGFYVALATLFGIGIWFFAGGDYAGQFFAGYVTEYALSVDNLFVFVILLTAFKVPRELQGRVVLIGIMIALVLRGGLIAAGAVLVAEFSWVFYLFGAFLVLTAVKLARGSEHDEAAEVPKIVGFLNRFLPMTHEYNGTKLRVHEGAKRLFTPLFAVIIALGVTDLVFALDSIPAIFGLTKEPFLVFTANAFALLGLSELFFLLGALLQKLVYLSKGLALILGFIGVKLVFEALADNTLPFINGGDPVGWAPHISPGLSLAVVGSILAVTVVASLVRNSRELDRTTPAPVMVTDLNDDDNADGSGVPVLEATGGHGARDSHTH